jgi:hypothetical protein
MVQNVNPTFVKTPNRGLVLISTGTGVTTQTLYTGGTNGSKVYGINICSGSSASTSVRYQISNSAINYVINTQSVAANTGFDGSTPPLNLMAPMLVPGLPIDSDGNPYLILASSADTLTINAVSTIASGSLYIIATAADF